MEVLGNPAIASFAIKFGLADKVRDLGSLLFAPLFSHDGSCSPDTMEWLSGFDLIVCYVFDPDRIFESNIRRYSPAKFVSGPHRPTEQSSTHASVQLLEPLRNLAEPSFEDGRRVALAASGWDGERSPSTIAIHPGSGSPKKNWPEEKWCSLLHRLVSTTGDPILLIGGEAERDRLPGLARLIPEHRRQIALEPPLVELADRLKGCRVFIGHDSGVTHLAAVLGLECIVLWGPSNESVWRPMGERVQILKHPENLRDLPVETVVNALNGLLTTP